jgi:hypothetical protein
MLLFTRQVMSNSKDSLKLGILRGIHKKKKLKYKIKYHPLSIPYKTWECLNDFKIIMLNIFIKIHLDCMRSRLLIFKKYPHFFMLTFANFFKASFN